MGLISSLFKSIEAGKIAAQREEADRREGYEKLAKERRESSEEYWRKTREFELAAQEALKRGDMENFRYCTKKAQHYSDDAQAVEAAITKATWAEVARRRPK